MTYYYYYNFKHYGLSESVSSNHRTGKKREAKEKAKPNEMGFPVTWGTDEPIKVKQPKLKVLRDRITPAPEPYQEKLFEWKALRDQIEATSRDLIYLIEENKIRALKAHQQMLIAQRKDVERKILLLITMLDD